MVTEKPDSRPIFKEPIPSGLRFLGVTSNGEAHGSRNRCKTPRTKCARGGARILLASRVSDVGHRIRLGRFLDANTVGDGRDLMDTAGGPYSALDNQIFACIEAAKASDKDAKLEDFQLKIVANDLVLINLKTSRAYLLYDEENELPSLRDMEELFPDLTLFPKQDQPEGPSRTPR